MIERLVRAGVWMQVTAGSLAGAFGRRAKYWSERMLDEGCVHILATDAHNMTRRPPNLGEGRALASKRVGDTESEHLVETRPMAVLLNDLPSNLPAPKQPFCSPEMVYHNPDTLGGSHRGIGSTTSRPSLGRRFVGRLRDIFN